MSAGAAPARRFPLVDSLRAIAALAIVGFHGAAVYGGFALEHAGRWLSQLNVGVPLFFAISGFLLYRPWIAARLDGARPPSLRVYAQRRVLRIVPAYWVALVLIALLVGRSQVFDRPGGLVYFGFAQAYGRDSFTGGIGQAWTLSVEVAFYAALPLLALAVRRLAGPGRRAILRGEVALLLGLVALSFAWRLVVLATLDPGDAAYYPLLAALPTQLDTFAGGMALAVLTAAGDGGRLGALVARAPWTPWALAAAAYSALSLWRPGEAGYALVAHELQGIVALGLLAPAVLGAGAGGAVRRLLAWRPLAWVGLVSYGLYLWHLDVLREVAELGLPRGVALPIGVALSLAAGAASWYGLERHALRLGRRAAGAEPADPHPGRPLPTTAETVGR
jgi:peptidoglycan/LPS O-acetylase OafA/YrhL